MTPTPNNKKTLAEMFEEILPAEMALGKENPFLKIMYDHAPNNAKFYEDNVNKINSFRKASKDLLTTAEADIEKRVREETLKEVEEWVNKKQNEYKSKVEYYNVPDVGRENAKLIYERNILLSGKQFACDDFLTFINSKRQ